MTIKEINRRAVKEFFESYKADGASVKVHSVIPFRDIRGEVPSDSESAVIMRIDYKGTEYYIPVYHDIILGIFDMAYKADVVVFDTMDKELYSEYV